MTGRQILPLPIKNQKSHVINHQSSIINHQFFRAQEQRAEMRPAAAVMLASRGLTAACCRCDARSLLRHGPEAGLVSGRERPPSASWPVLQRQQAAPVHGRSTDSPRTRKSRRGEGAGNATPQLSVSCPIDWRAGARRSRRGSIQERDMGSPWPKKGQWEALRHHSSGVAKAMPGQVWLFTGIGPPRKSKICWISRNSVKSAQTTRRYAH